MGVITILHRHARTTDGLRTLLAFATTLLLGCGGGPGEPPPPPPGAIPAGQSIGSAVIAGRVSYRGTPPPRRPVKMSEAACRHDGEGTLSEDLIAHPDGGLRNAYLHVISGLGDRVFAPPAQPAEMDQAGCIFVPHLLAVQTNQVILFKNSDPAVHNVRALAERNRTFNISMSGKGRSARRFFSQPEIVRVRCDIHAWMQATIAVDSHPFQAVTGEDGSFALQGLPPGTYEVEAWHEKLGSSRQTITLAEGERREVEFVFGE